MTDTVLFYGLQRCGLRYTDQCNGTDLLDFGIGNDISDAL